MVARPHGAPLTGSQRELIGKMLAKHDDRIRELERRIKKLEDLSAAAQIKQPK